MVYHVKYCLINIIKCLHFLARVLAKALKMLFWTLPATLIKFSTFSRFSISDEIIIEIYHQIFNLQFFFDQIESNLSKMDQTWSHLISDEIIIEIYHQIFNLIYFLIRLNQICQNGSEWIKLDQNGSKRIKLDQIRFLMKQPLKFITRFSTLYIFLIRLNQICQNESDWIKTDQTWSN